MTLSITYPTPGRTAWPESGLGGTLDATGKAPGSLYRAPVGDQQFPGLVGYRAVKAGTVVDINSYAVFNAVRAIQTMVGAGVDGLFGQETAARLVTWQDNHGLVDDGLFGGITSMAMFSPFVKAAASRVTTDDTARASIRKLAQGHIGHESSWDPGAVGGSTPQDLGLGQINGPAHPDLTVEDRLNPRIAITSVVYIVQANLDAMGGVETDAIAAYYLGVAGAKEWVRLDRPDVWKGKPVKLYIRSVLAAAQ